MNVVYAQEPFDQPRFSIFLAGPTPRSSLAMSWRPEALQILESLDSKLTVFVPEPRSGVWGDYTGQIDWEWAGLTAATAIAFWVPRNMATMPALTTNVEWGVWASSGKCVLGSPPGAEHVRYLHAMASRLGVPAFEGATLEHTLQEALRLCILR
jgi:hypothetical protein